ncbi:MAG TPA: PepSY domain-containing protein [Solirubrobacterales bacterium]|nr:PepSY domain-containing protein [Solirubrobacterales bacterium]
MRDRGLRAAGPVSDRGLSLPGESSRSSPPAAATLAFLIVALVVAAIGAPSALAAGQEISRSEAIAAANRNPTVREEKGRHPELGATAVRKEGHWEVGYFEAGRELALAIVDPHSGEVLEAWTGNQVAWKMARGYSGAFGHKLNAPYVFVPLCAIFLLGLVDWRRLWRVANLDLAALLGFGISHYFFNRAEIGVSVPLVYPVLLYLLGRSLWIGWRGRGEGLRPVWPTMWLVIAALFLMGFRVGLNVADSGAIDVGYAGVVGADRIAHGEPIYGNFPDDISQGDTYGPVNYLAYVPFERIWPWSGHWDDLPAAHATAVVFDVATFVLLLLLGIRIRPGPEGQRLAAILAFGWAAYPYPAYVLESNSNDSLVAALLVATLVLAARPLARGGMLAAATWAKFAPAVLGPMFLTYRPAAAASGGDSYRTPSAECPYGVTPGRLSMGRRRRWLLFLAGFAAVTVAVMLWPAVDPGLKAFYDRTIASQAGRSSPFSIWGQVPSLEPVRIALLAATGALAVALALVPRRKNLVQLAALSAALLILLQLTLHHWFYLYVVWWFPLLLAAMAAVEGRATPESPPEPSPARTSQPAPAG